eukprot:m.350289 g.350289  ORF g.350289 m.350289 type:complete len:180 (+) comp16158_c0_seq2:8304-8843(+)
MKQAGVSSQDDVQSINHELTTRRVQHAVLSDQDAATTSGSMSEQSESMQHSDGGDTTTGTSDLTSRSVLYLYGKGLTNTHLCSQYNMFLLTPQRKLQRQFAWSMEASRKTRTVSQHRTVVENVFGELKTYCVIAKPVSIARAQLADIEMEVARIFVNLKAERSQPEERADIFKYCTFFD